MSLQTIHFWVLDQAHFWALEGIPLPAMMPPHQVNSSSSLEPEVNAEPSGKAEPGSLGPCALMAAPASPLRVPRCSAESTSLRSPGLSSPAFSVRGILQARRPSGLPFASPWDLPDPGIKLRSPAWQADYLSSEPHFTHSSADMSMLSSQFVPSSPCSLPCIWSGALCMTDVFKLI